MNRLLKYSATFIGLLGLIVTLGAAVTANSFVTSQNPNRGYWQFVPVVSGCNNCSSAQNTPQTIYTANNQFGSRCNAIMYASSDPSATHQVTWRIYHGVDIVTSITVTVPINAGLTLPAQPGLGPTISTGLPTDQYSNQYFFLAQGDTVAVMYNGAITASSAIFVYLMCSDYTP